MIIDVKPFGTTSNGKNVEEITLDDGIVKVELLSYGATLKALLVPDNNGGRTDVVLGYDTLSEYENNGGHFGAIIGRTNGRIPKGEFTMNGKKYCVDKNDGENHLHGGKYGFDRLVWTYKLTKNGVQFFLHSPDGDMGYPSAVDTIAEYSLDNGVMTIKITAQSDGDTPLSYTNHAYFNLEGAGSKDIFGHELMVSSQKYCEIDEHILSNGKFAQVDGTVFDLRAPKNLGEAIHTDDKLMRLIGGFDEVFALDNGGKIKCAAELYAPKTGISMSLDTDMPAMGIYTSNMLKTTKGKGGATYVKHSAVCLEAQGFPNTVNMPSFGNCILHKGETYQKTMIYKFKVK